MPNLNVPLTELELTQSVRRLPDLDPAYIFQHALTQETASFSLLHRSRREIHRLVANAYVELYKENLDEYAALLSEHYWQGEAWLLAAEAAMHAGDHAMRGYALPEALFQYDRALNALAKIDAAPAEVIDATLGWMRPAIKLEDYATLLERLGHAETLARTTNDKPRLAKILHSVADVHFANGRTSLAAPALFENYQIAVELGDEKLSLVPSYWLAFFMVDRNPTGALAQFEQVIELAHKYGNPEIEAYAIATQALAHSRLGEYASSRREIKHALSILDQVKSPMGQADINTLSGFTYLELGELDLALRYTRQGATNAKKAKVYECEIAGMLGVGFCQLQRNALLEAQGMFDESVRLAEDIGSDNLRHQARSGLVVAHYLNGQATAIPEMETALENSRAIGDEFGSAFLSHMLGNAYTQTNPTRAEMYLDEALAFYRREQMRPYIARTLLSLATLYELRGRAAEADNARAEMNALMQGLQSTSEPTAADAELRAA